MINPCLIVGVFNDLTEFKVFPKKVFIVDLNYLKKKCLNETVNKKLYDFVTIKNLVYFTNDKDETLHTQTRSKFRLFLI